jgi:hypothetical protein
MTRSQGWIIIGLLFYICMYVDINETLLAKFIFCLCFILSFIMSISEA